MQVRNVVRNVTAHVALLVGPELPPTRAEQHDCTLWDASVNALPSLDVCGRYLIVRIVFALFSHVHNHGRTNEAGKWDLVHGRFAFREMNRAVDMGTAMLTRSISASGIPRACLGLAPTQARERLRHSASRWCFDQNCWSGQPVWIRPVQRASLLRNSVLERAK